MKISNISTYKDFLTLEEDWKLIFKRSQTNNIFLSWDWCLLWLKHFLKKQKLMIIVVRDEKEIVGIAPLIKYNSSALTFWRPTVRFIGGDFADYMDFLVLRNNKQVIKTIVNYLINLSNWGMIEFGRIPESSPNYILLKECLSGLKYQNIMRVSCVNPFINIEGEWDDYCKSIKKGLKWLKIKPALRRFGSLENTGFETFDGSNSKTVLDSFFELHKKRQVYKIGRSLFETETNRDFFRDLAFKFLDHGWVDITAIKIRNKVISVVYAFKYNEVYYYWNPAFDPEFIKYAPGKVHVHNLIKNCFEHNYEKFDFMRGDEEYKFKWSNNIFNNNYEMKICRNTIFLKLDSIKNGWRKFIKNMYNKHPLFKKAVIKASKIKLFSQVKRI